MKSKQQKSEDLAYGKDMIGGAQSVVFVDFNKTSSNDLNTLRRTLSQADASMKVIKKTLLGLITKEKEIPVDVSAFEGQVGTIVSQRELTEPAHIVSQLINEKGGGTSLAFLGGYDVASARAYDAQEMVRIGNLPARDVLLAQLVGMIAAPLRSFLYVLGQVGESKGGEAPLREEVKDSEPPTDSSKESGEKSEEVREVPAQEEESSGKKEEELVQEKKQEETPAQE